MNRFLVEPPRRTEVLGEYDVVVLGGGPSGCAAAVAAGRMGASVALVEGYGFLGGMGTAASVSNFCGLYAGSKDRYDRVVTGLMDDVLAALARDGALREPHSVYGKTLAQAYDNVVYRCVLDDLALEASVDLHLHTHGAGVVREGDAVTALLVENRSGRFALAGRMFVDASGDAAMSRWAGVPTEVAEELAWPTTMFRVGNVDAPRALAEGKPHLAALTAQARRDGWTLPRRVAYVNPQRHPSEWRVNATQLGEGDRAFDCSDAGELTRAELQGRAQMRTFFRFLKERVPGFESSYLLDVGAQVGVRETRRVVGPFVLNEDDVVRGSVFEDAIGCNGWPIEEHRSSGVEWQWLEGRGFHDIPLRAVETQVPNLFVVGRGASLSHRAQASLRVTGPCFVMGQGAGTLAALAARHPSGRAGVSYQELRAALGRAGVFFG